MKPSVRMTEAEWEVMGVVWQRASAPASDIAEALRESRRWSLATVRTLLRRLVNKGALAQRAEGKRYLYTPLVSIEACIHEESNSFWDRILRRAPLPALLHMVQRADLSKADLQELRRILLGKKK
jgi:BlaI family penicillinase repressor